MNKEAESDLKRCQEAVEALSEFFDSVHVFATRHQGNDIGTVNVSYGCGNWFARRGQISEWLLKEEESTRKSIHPPCSEDES